MLGRARRPILIAGLGVYWCNASAELVKLAERIGAPVLTTTKCKGMIPEDHPLRAGCVIGGLIERKLVMEADLIIAVGLDAVELQPKPWPYTLPVLALSSIPSLDAFVPADPKIVGDLKALLAACAMGAGGTNWGEKAAKTFRHGRARRAQHAKHRAVAAAHDGGRARGAAAQHHRDLRCRRQPPPGRAEMGSLRAARVPHLQRAGSMGYAVPGALAARLAFPDRPVVAFTGDGGFLMTIAELQTAQRENLPIIVLVFDDQEIGLIRVKQEIKEIPAHGVHIRRRRLGEARAFLWRRRRRGRHRAGLKQCAECRAEVQAHHRDRRAHRCVRLCGAVQRAARAVSAG